MNAMKILSAAEMQACDRATSEHFGVPSLQLMRNASAAVAACARQCFPDSRQVVALCGRGNNGGDGMMAARLLAEAGLQVSVVLLGAPAEIKGDAAQAWRELRDSASCSVHVVETDDQFAQISTSLVPDLILDAVVGTGFKPPLRGLPLVALAWAKEKNVSILAVDLPSGWPSDAIDASVDTPVFPADAVVTFTVPKPAHVFGQLTRFWHQPVIVAPIGSPQEAVVSTSGMTWAGSSDDLLHAPRAVDANKGKFGHVLVVGGSFGSSGGKAGAPSMAALAAMRVGAGLVTAAVPAPSLPVVAGFAAELMTIPLQVNGEGQISPENLKPHRIQELAKGMTVLAIGPGLGQRDDAAHFCIGLLRATTVPTVIDADALNILSTKPDILSELASDGRVIAITPHPGEMARLAGIKTSEVQANRLQIARDFAQKHHITVVLKGSRTLVAHPDGRVAVNTSGNPGMAKGGSGDLLTGIVAGMLAQFSGDSASAIEAAVFLHGLAADLAVRDGDEHTLLATDCLAYFSRAFRFRSRGANGYVWLQGLPPGIGSAKGSPEAAT